MTRPRSPELRQRWDLNRCLFNPEALVHLWPQFQRCKTGEKQPVHTISLQYPTPLDTGGDRRSLPFRTVHALFTGFHSL